MQRDGPAPEDQKHFGVKMAITEEEIGGREQKPRSEGIPTLQRNPFAQQRTEPNAFRAGKKVRGVHRGRRCGRFAPRVGKVRVEEFCIWRRDAGHDDAGRRVLGDERQHEFYRRRRVPPQEGKDHIVHAWLTPPDCAATQYPHAWPGVPTCRRGLRRWGFENPRQLPCRGMRSNQRAAVVQQTPFHRSRAFYSSRTEHGAVR